MHRKYASTASLVSAIIKFSFFLQAISKILETWVDIHQLQNNAISVVE
jgi:hypothetical protein